MNSKKYTNFFKRLPLWLRIISGALIVLLVLVGAFFGYFALWNYKNSQAEKLIDQKFHSEVAQISQMKVKNFMLWEGDSMVTAEIVNKGEVRFWYGKDGVPRIDSLGQYSTSYTCFYVDSNGKKTGYAYDTGLTLDKDGKYAKWFSFQVNNLKDLADKYDLMVGVLATFPKNPSTMPFEDSWGKRDVIAHSNPDFVLKEQFRGKEVWCDLHQ